MTTQAKTRVNIGQTYQTERSAAFVERINLSLRQHVAAIGRRVTTLCKGEEGLRQQLALFQVYNNFVLPHTKCSHESFDE